MSKFYLYFDQTLEKYCFIFLIQLVLQVPQCCENGIAVKISQKNFGGYEMRKCYDRSCFSCLSQQYLLGIHERCSLDQSLMKSLCAPGLSCMIYCSEKSTYIYPYVSNNLYSFDEVIFILRLSGIHNYVRQLSVSCRQLSGSSQLVIRQSSGSHYAVVRHKFYQVKRTSILVSQMTRENPLGGTAVRTAVPPSGFPRSFG